MLQQLADNLLLDTWNWHLDNHLPPLKYWRHFRLVSCSKNHCYNMSLNGEICRGVERDATMEIKGNIAPSTQCIESNIYFAGGNYWASSICMWNHTETISHWNPASGQRVETEHGQKNTSNNLLHIPAPAVSCVSSIGQRKYSKSWWYFKSIDLWKHNGLLVSTGPWAALNFLAPS